jgi:hypothetical protein
MDRIFVIDRIVDGAAICECLQTGERMEILAKDHPRVKEGDIIRLLPEGGFEIDEGLTAKRLENLTNRMNRLFAR